MMKKIVAFLCMLFPGLAVAHDYTAGDVVVVHPFALETTATAMTGAGYFTITNAGKQADRLLAIEASFPQVMMHETQTKDDIATMVHLESVEIPAGSEVVFEPGGKHVMFMGLAGDPFEVGEEIPATLVFETAGRVEIVFLVEARESVEDNEAHSGH